MITRRRFLSNGTLAAAPLVLPGRILGGPGRTSPSDTLLVGVIGAGARGQLLIDQLPEMARVVAVADCWLTRCEEAAAKRKAGWRLYQDYRRLLDDPQIDAVIVATTDHGRVLPCIHACQAGKDVYAEKPLTLYVNEGRTLVKAARKYKRVFQVGSQQRSMEMNRLASEFVRNGGLGKLRLVQGFNYPGPGIYDSPEDPMPEKLDWDMWLGQAPLRPYSKKRHLSWMGDRDYSGGEMTNWGAHGLDQIQMALGMSHTGPVEFEPLEAGDKAPLAFRYADGLEVRLELTDSKFLGGALFTGDKGKIEIVRNNFRTEPAGMVPNLPPPEDVQKWRDEVALWQARYHMQDWIDCIRTRQTPRADVEIGHRSVSLAHLCNITRELGRKLRWDPEAERFLGDDQANRLLDRPRRKGYELPEI